MADRQPRSVCRLLAGCRPADMFSLDCNLTGSVMPGPFRSRPPRAASAWLALLLAAALPAAAAVPEAAQDQMVIAREAIAVGDLRGAEMALRNVVQDHPRNAEAHYRLGAVLLQLGDPAGAEQELRQAQATGWLAGDLRPQIARALLAQGRFADVLKEFPAKEVAPDDLPGVLAIRALALLGEQNLDAAQALIAEAERLAPDNVDVLLAAARVAIVRRDPRTADAKVARALEINPASPEALMLNAMGLRARGNDEAAVAALDAAIAASPRTPTLRLDRASTLIALRRDKEARADVDHVLRMDPRNPQARYLLAVLLVRAQSWTEADAALTGLGADLGRFPYAEFLLALTKANIGAIGPAFEAASRYVALSPRDPDGIRLLARLHVQAGRLREAIEVLSRAADAGLADGDLLDMLARAYAQTGQTAAAIHTLDRASAAAAASAEALARIAALRMALGDPVGAARDLSRAVELAPDAMAIREQLVTASLAAGDPDRGAAELEVLRHRPGADPARIANLTGMVRTAQIDLDGARVAFEAALAASPGNPQIGLSLAKVLVLQGQWPRAEALLTGILRQEPANLSALALMSALLRAENKNGRLMPLALAAQQAAPADAAVTLGAADLLLRAGDAPGAYALAQGLPAALAGQPAVLAARARLQAAQHLDGEARDSLRQLLAVAPGEAEARLRLIELLLTAKQPDEARRVARDGVALAPGDLRLLQAEVEVDLRTGGVEAALATAALLAAEPASQPAAWLLKGWVFNTAGRYGEAAAAFRAELDAHPSPALATATAMALDQAGRKDEAARLLADWIARRPADLEVLAVLSSLEVQNHQMDAAAAHLEALLAKRPDDAMALNNLAWIYQQRGDPRAHRLALRSYLLVPGPDVADTLGWIITVEGDAAKGLPLLREAAAQRGQDPEVLYHLAVALDRVGETRAAVAALTQALALPEGFDEAAAARALLEKLGK